MVGHLPALRCYALGLTGDRHAADDLVQDCIERALRRIDTLTVEQKLAAWLRSILFNLFMDARRTSRSRGEIAEPALQLSAIAFLSSVFPVSPTIAFRGDTPQRRGLSCAAAQLGLLRWFGVVMTGLLCIVPPLPPPISDRSTASTFAWTRPCGPHSVSASKDKIQPW